MSLPAAPAGSDPRKPAAPDPALIFDWRPVRRVRRGLFVWLGVATAAHLGFFYLFKVVLPPASRTLPPERSALFLPGESPREARVLVSARDRVPGLQDPSSLDDPEFARLQALVKDYSPTWRSHVATLRTLPEADARMALPSLFAGAGSVLLPPLPANPNADAVFVPSRAPASASAAADNADSAIPAPPPPNPFVTVLSGLSDRALAAQPEWPKGLFDENLTDREEAPFMISVDPAGRVISCLPMDAPPGMDPERLRPVLLSLKFSASDRPGPQWGRVDVRW